MKKYIISFIGILTFFMSFSSNLSFAESDEQLKSAQQFANNHFKEIVLAHVKSEDAENYNLTKSENIDVGKLYQVSFYSQEFVTTEKEIKDNNNGINPGNEWVSVVYQDGKPVNVIGTFKNSNGEFELSTFGYGNDLAEAIDSKKSMGGKLIYELPTDSWFLFENGRVSALNNPAKAMLEEKEVSLGDFRKFVFERYKNSQKIIENGEITSVGGNYATPYDEVLSKSNDGNSIYLYLVASLLVLSSIYGFFYFRKGWSKS